MIRALFSLVVLLFGFFNLIGQDLPTYLKQHAVKIDRLDSLSEEVYNLTSDYQLIMLGEMHGSNESADFLIGLAELFAKNRDTVRIGLEIPSAKMSKYLSDHTENSIYDSDFFVNPTQDGRASAAIARIISKFNNNPMVAVFFYDVNDGDCKKISDRDSIMYVKIKKQMLEHSTSKIITLSGNIHNMILPYKGANTMGVYMTKDTALIAAENICSLNNYYQRGSMYANFGQGLKVTEIGNVDNEYSRLTDYDKYLFLFPVNYHTNYHGIYFTRTLTIAKMANDK